jgi:hypothetical protein
MDKSDSCKGTGSTNSETKRRDPFWELIERARRERDIASLKRLIRALGEAPVTLREAACLIPKGGAEAKRRDQERHAFLLEAQYQIRVRQLLEEAIARNRIVSDEMNGRYLERLLEQALPQIEEREEELVAHPRALEEIIQPMLRQMIVEEARFIWGWDEAA